jgi:hypothetical protein
MSDVHKRVLIWLALGVCVAAATWWWFANMEQRWEATRVVRNEDKGLPIKAASLFLKKYGYQVSTSDSLSKLVDQLPQPKHAGTIMLPISDGVISPAQAKQLLAWVAQGNTLITTPHFVSKGERASRLLGDAIPKDNEENVIDADPILTHFGLSVKARKSERDDDAEEDDEYAAEEDSESEAENEDASEQDAASDPAQSEGMQSTQQQDQQKRSSTLIQFPPHSYPLELSRSYTRLISKREQPLALFSDAESDSVRVYQQGRGHVVVMTHTPFLDYELDHFDHAEILLNLVKLSAGKQLRIVQNTDMPKWYVALWNAFTLPLIGLLCLLSLALWRVIPRFGSVLPEPHTERRSLIEHVDASGRWLWTIPGGRDLLLAAARKATTDLIHRRALALRRLSLDAQMEQIGQKTGIASALITSAFLHPAADTSFTFTQQIHTLQQVRKHYEQSRP